MVDREGAPVTLVERRFVTVAGRQVHYRTAGSGPAVVLLHQSPRDSREVEPMMRRLAARFTVFAPDTPGYGLSEPLAEGHEPLSIDVFADALRGFLGAVGLNRVGLYGSHTGGIIALRFAVRYPEQAAAVVSNGLLLMEEAERTDKLRNLFPAFKPCWDGSHLTWLWSRLRDQLIFYPWDKRTASARIAWPMSLDEIQQTAIDFLRAGDHYRSAYRAVTAYDPRHDLGQVATPAMFVVAQGDALVKYWDKFPTLQPTTELVQAESSGAAYDRAEDFLVRHATTFGQPPPRRSAPAIGLAGAIAQVTGGDLHVRYAAAGPGRPVVVLHDWGRSARSLQPVLGGFVGRRPVYAPDLPGHGESTAPLPSTIAGVADLVLEGLDRLDLDAVDVVADGGAWAVAVEMRDKDRGRVRRLAICNPFLPDADQAPVFRREAETFAPDWAGSHLTRAWHFARDQSTAWPWYDRSAAAALRDIEPEGADVVHRRAVDLMQASAAYPSAIGFAVAADPAALDDPADGALVCHAVAGHPSRKALARAPRRLPADQADWASHLMASWEGLLPD